MPKSAQAVKVSLIETATIPTRKGHFIEDSLEEQFAVGEEVVFEPKVNTLHSDGLSSIESILTVNANGNLLIPLQNFRQSSTNPEAGMELGTAVRFDGQIKNPESKQSTCAQLKMLQQSEQKLALAQSTKSIQCTKRTPNTGSTSSQTLSDWQAIFKNLS